jgi:hypothetical protein
MTDQPDDWLAAERERKGCATVLGTRGAWIVTKGNYPREAPSLVTACAA